MVKNVVLATLWYLSAISYLNVTIYGFRLLKIDWELEKRTEKLSIQRPTIIGGRVGCTFLVGSCIYFSFTFWVDYDIDFLYYTFAAAPMCIGGGLLNFSFLAITTQSIQAMVHAEAALQPHEKGGWFYCGSISHWQHYSLFAQRSWSKFLVAYLQCFVFQVYVSRSGFCIDTFHTDFKNQQLPLIWNGDTFVRDARNLSIWL